MELIFPKIFTPVERFTVCIHDDVDPYENRPGISPLPGTTSTTGSTGLRLYPGNPPRFQIHLRFCNFVYMMSSRPEMSPTVAVKSVRLCLEEPSVLLCSFQYGMVQYWAISVNTVLAITSRKNFNVLNSAICDEDDGTVGVDANSRLPHTEHIRLSEIGII